MRRIILLAAGFVVADNAHGQPLDNGFDPDNRRTKI